MPKRDLTQFKGLTFDTIGTLADFETGLLQWCQPRLPKELRDNQILESFARVEKSLHVSQRPRCRYRIRYSSTKQLDSF